jgi:hypothetical protein
MQSLSSNNLAACSRATIRPLRKSTRTAFNARPVGIYGHAVKGRYDAIGHLVLPAFWPCHSDSLAVDLQQVSFSDVVCERISAKTSMISMILRSCRFKQLLSAAVYTDLQQYDIVPM